MKYDREKTLFVTDMDGTLLSPDAQMSSYTAEILREAIFRGYNFTIASGRMPESPKHIFESHSIQLQLPVIGRNGVLIFDPKIDEYLQIHMIPRTSAEQMLKLIQEYGTQIFLIESVDSSGLPKFNKRGTAGFSKLPKNMDSLFYIAVDGAYEQLAPLYTELLKLPGVGGVLSGYDYIPGVWYAELFSKEASKGNGVRYVKERYGFSRVVCFGDNMNDLAMFEVSDETYAPENAVSEVRAAAGAIIGSNEADGVARWIEENLLD